MPPSDPNNNIEWWKLAVQIAGYAVTWLIVLVGWNVNSRQNDRRDTRKELREHVDAAIQLIRDAESNGIKFLGESAASEALYWSVYFSVQRIVPAVEELPLPNQQALMRQLVLFRRLMTAKVTVGPNTVFPPEPERRALLLEVSRGANRFVSALEDGYRKCYPLAAARNCRSDQ